MIGYIIERIKNKKNYDLNFRKDRERLAKQPQAKMYKESFPTKLLGGDFSIFKALTIQTRSV